MDHSLFFLVNQRWAHPVLDWVFMWVTLWWGFGVPVGLLMLIAFRRRWRREGTLLWVFLVGVLLVGEAGGRVVKYVASQPRPCYEMPDEVRQPDRHQPGPCGNGLGGMPSNHALDYFAGATLVAATFRSRRWAVLCFGIAALAAFSRIYLGKHYPSQVLAGACIGVLWGLAAAAIAKRKLRLVRAGAGGDAPVPLAARE
jgi:undecaprenyl-diphosphatase